MTGKRKARDDARRVDLGGTRIIPKGADRPLPEFTEEDVQVTPADVDRAIRKWNEMMPDEWKGFLEAEIATPPKDDAETQ